MSPYPEIVEVEGSLIEVGVIDGNYGIRVETQDGLITIVGLEKLSVAGLGPGIYGQVRITIEPIDEDESS